MDIVFLQRSCREVCHTSVLQASKRRQQEETKGPDYSSHCLQRAQSLLDVNQVLGHLFQNSTNLRGDTKALQLETLSLCLQLEHFLSLGQEVLHKPLRSSSLLRLRSQKLPSCVTSLSPPSQSLIQLLQQVWRDGRRGSSTNRRVASVEQLQTCSCKIDCTKGKNKKGKEMKETKHIAQRSRMESKCVSPPPRAIVPEVGAVTPEATTIAGDTGTEPVVAGAEPGQVDMFT